MVSSKWYLFKREIIMKKQRVPIRFTGQHFTIDTPLIEDAIYLADIQKEDLVMDIGAGHGFISNLLIQHADNVLSLENDALLAAELKSRFKFYKTIDIIETDFRNFIIPQKSFKVVSNIPFSITSYILKSLMFTHCEYFTQGCLIMQFESAQKLVRQKFFNSYIVFYHTFYNLEFMYEVSPNSFSPPPKVRSALLKMDKKNCKSINYEMKDSYLDFLNFMLKFPDLPVRTALKKIFRKQQVREISKLHNVKLEKPVYEMSAQEFWACFKKMKKIVPSKLHP